ncbi:MAG: Por secretion system C-terminal sorting protein [Ignavibacteria bacterium]|nr:Por secretion system C-terminal sorting protein [Ignavibacteria bacterium]
MYLYDTAMQRNRISTYYGMDKIGVPCGRVNGLVAEKTGTNYYGAVGDTVALTMKVDSFATTSPIKIDITAINTGLTGQIEVAVTSTSAISLKKLRIIVVEQSHYYDAAGNNGEKDFECLARAMLPDFNGTTLTLKANETKKFNFNWNIKPGINFDFNIVAFVQDDGTKEILQAESIESSPLYSITSANSTNFYPGVKGMPSSKDFSIENNSGKPVTVSIQAIKTPRTPSDWTAEVSIKNNFVINANSYKDITLDFTPGATTGIGDAYMQISFVENSSLVINSPQITMLSTNVKTLQVTDDDSKYSIHQSIMKRKPASEYIEISGDNYLTVSNSLDDLRNLVWDIGAAGQLTSAKAKAITDAINNGANVLVCGNQAVGNLNTYNALPFFGVQYLGWNMEGFGYSPWRIWIAGVPGDPITEFLGANKEGNLINYLLPVLKIVDKTNTFPLLHFQNDGRYVNINSRTDTIPIKAEDAIFAVRTLASESRLILMSFCPYVVVSQKYRDLLVYNSIQWLESGIVGVEEDAASVEKDDLSLAISPNPIDREATINFSLNGDSPSLVRLSLFDMLGQEVSVLKNNVLTPGKYDAFLSNANLANGRYSLVLRSGGKYVSLPVVIIR